MGLVHGQSFKVPLYGRTAGDWRLNLQAHTPAVITFEGSMRKKINSRVTLINAGYSEATK